MDDDLKTPLVVGEIEEVDAAPENVTPRTSEQAKHVRTKVPEVEIHLYRQGKGPVTVFKSPLGGWEQDQIEVRDILEKHGLKSVFAFNPRAGGRGVPVRFNPRNGRSMLTYRDGAVVHLDGDPTDSLIKPVTRILVGVALIVFMITLVSRDPPDWLKKLNFSGVNFPPWILACVVIVFTRMRKRTKDFLKKRGW
ncbi:hypothetical protein PHAVU_004G088200 [Phaseolus vulgaris]|uniref:Uncharacterized protein n=1 Tax=Phaseolus vulgaris TaxID=3885 RepID=V7C3G8_PHAVU|nr:hypothetical protein PHAVU_004G088200g [Phaseolus vulgaris]ESW23928.1 hypothetical protein PHAVU_004G088200g [Phaseolus vulgaris]